MPQVWRKYESYWLPKQLWLVFANHLVSPYTVCSKTKFSVYNLVLPFRCRIWIECGSIERIHVVAVLDAPVMMEMWCLQADYERPSSASSVNSNAAMVNGDVLADDNNSTASAGRACNGYRLQNNIYWIDSTESSACGFLKSTSCQWPVAGMLFVYSFVFYLLSLSLFVCLSLSVYSSVSVVLHFVFYSLLVTICTY